MLKSHLFNLNLVNLNQLMSRRIASQIVENDPMVRVADIWLFSIFNELLFCRKNLYRSNSKSAFWSFVELEQVGFKHRPNDLTRLLRYDSRSVPAGGGKKFGLVLKRGQKHCLWVLQSSSISRMLIPRTHIRNPYIPFFPGKWAYIPFHRKTLPPTRGGIYLMNESLKIGI